MMRMLGGKFVPGFRVNIDHDDEDDFGGGGGGVAVAPAQPQEAEEVPEQAVLRVGQRSNSTTTSSEEESSAADCSSDVEQDSEEYETFTRLRKQHSLEDQRVLRGTDWESVNYNLREFNCEEDEITGLDVSSSYIAVQYYIESAIDVYDRATFEKRFRLEGHEYGGQCLKICEDSGALYSASMDCSLKSWNLNAQSQVHSVTDHADYVYSMEVYQGKGDDCDIVATGGKGDKALFIYNVSKQGKFSKKYKLEGHKGWIVSIKFVTEDGRPPVHLVSASQGSCIKIWNLDDGSCLQTLEQCAGLTCMLKSTIEGFENRLFLFGDKEGKLSFVDLEQSKEWKSNTDDYDPDVYHLLPNILIGTGKYCRSCKYHDKAVDVAHLTDNGYLVTASEGSKYVKIWKIHVPTSNGLPDLERTEVRELQILRDHTDYLSTFCVYEDTVYSCCSDGKIYAHTFPKMSSDSGDCVHYDMAFDDVEAGTTASASLAAFNNPLKDQKTLQQFSTKSHDNCTEICDGPRMCRTGKAGLVRSSSSFQVSFQLKPSVAEVDGRVRLPTVAAAAATAAANIRQSVIQEDSEEEESDSEYDVIYVSGSEEEDTDEEET